MALIKLGTGETQPFKKSGGSIIQTSRGGLTLRNAPKFRGQRTPNEWNLNRFLMYATRHWRAMTATQQNNWHSWATTYPQYVERDPTQPINGYNLFTKINYYRALHQGPAFSFLTEPAPVYYAADPVAIKIYWSESGISMNLDFTRGVGDLICFIFVSNVASKGLSFGDTRWRFAVSLPSTDANVDLTAFFLQNFAKLPEIGQNVFVSVVFIGSNNGQYSFHELAKITVEEAPPPILYPKYGLLYNGHAVLDARGFAPPGWRVPTRTEYQNLSTFFGGNAISGGKMKETGTLYWLPPNTGASNDTKLSLRGAGQRQAVSGIFSAFRQGILLRCRNFGSPTTLEAMQLGYSAVSISFTGILARTAGTSVRCIRTVSGIPNGTIGELVAIDGTKYPTITWNNIEYMAASAMWTKYANGANIPLVNDNTTWASLTTGAYCFVDNNPANT